MPGPATGAGSPHSLWPVTPFVLWPCVTLAATMTKLLVAKVLCMVGVFFFMLLGSLLPVKVIEADLEKAHRSKKVLSLCNTFGGGVFLATCFNALLPAVRDKLQQVLSLGHISTDYPLAETLMMVGFFLTVFVEQLVLTFRRERPPFIDLETFNAGSDAGSDSEYESPFVGVGNRSHSLYPEPTAHTHGAGLRLRELGRPGPLRLLSLVFALSAHSVFEGLALGLQEEGERVVSLFVGVAIHETLVAVALGISMARSAVPLRDAAKLAVTVSAMIPVGIGLGLGIESARSVASSVASALLQGLAGGTFLMKILSWNIWRFGEKQGQTQELKFQKIDRDLRDAHGETAAWFTLEMTRLTGSHRKPPSYGKDESHMTETKLPISLSGN